VPPDLACNGTKRRRSGGTSVPDDGRIPRSGVKGCAEQPRTVAGPVLGSVGRGHRRRGGTAAGTRSCSNPCSNPAAKSGRLGQNSALSRGCGEFSWHRPSGSDRGGRRVPPSAPVVARRLVRRLEHLGYSVQLNRSAAWPRRDPVAEQTLPSSPGSVHSRLYPYTLGEARCGPS